MPIDDINYLLENSTKDAFMLFIDSSRRDRQFYPDPSEYVLTFEEPLKHVYGLDIMDATIPNTMHNIDSINNEFVMVLLKSSYDETQDPSGFNRKLVTLVSEQQTNIDFQKTLGSFTRRQTFIINRVDWEAHPEVQAFLNDPITDATLVPVTTIDSTLILVSRFDQVPLTPLQSLPVQLQDAYLQDDAYISFETAAGVTYLILATHALADVIRSAQIDAISLMLAPNGSYTVAVSTNVPVPLSHGGAGHVIAQVGPGTPSIEYYLLDQHAIAVEVGTYNVNTLQEELQTQLGQIGIYVVSTDRTESADLVKQGRVMFVNNEMPFLLNMSPTTCACINSNLGFDTHATLKEAGLYAKCPSESNEYLFASIYNADKGRFQIRAPGNINLLGMRYITLRCKEIEDHLSSSLTYNRFTTGIGAFKLQDIRDVTNLRFDFVTFLQKPFHPIGKLTRLTLRFETPAGKLYDFKGFNHHIMISIKFFAPNMLRSFHRSSLNPEYDPDYVRYITNVAHAATQEALDDEDDEDDDSDMSDESNEAEDEDEDGEVEEEDDDGVMRMMMPFARSGPSKHLAT